MRRSRKRWEKVRGKTAACCKMTGENLIGRCGGIVNGWGQACGGSGEERTMGDRIGGKRKVRRFCQTAALHPVVSPGGEKYTVSAPAYSFGHTACTLSLRAPQSMPSCISRIYLLKSFLKKLVLFSLLLSPQLVANARRRSFCFWFRRRGTSTFTVRYRFPRIRG